MWVVVNELSAGAQGLWISAALVPVSDAVAA